MPHITKIFQSAGLVMLLLVPYIALAQGPAVAEPNPRRAPGAFTQGFQEAFGIGEDSGISVDPDNAAGSVRSAILRFLRILLSLIAILALVAIVWAGFVYITSFGNEDRLRNAKRVILYAIIGLVVVIFSAFMINIITSFLQSASSTP